MTSKNTMPTPEVPAVPADRPAGAGRLRSLAGPAARALLAVCALGLGSTADWLAQRTAALRHETLELAQDAALRRSEASLAVSLFSIDPQERRRLRLTATAYCPDCLAGEDSPQASALGTVVRAGRTVAVSRDLRRLLGRTVAIEGFGVRVVEDLMHPRFAGRMDLCLPDKRQALDFGVQNLDVLVLD
jgi:3D (Asp-Asp-Asp) domain-containing protein